MIGRFKINKLFVCVFKEEEEEEVKKKCKNRFINLRKGRRSKSIAFCWRVRTRVSHGAAKILDTTGDRWKKKL